MAMIPVTAAIIRDDRGQVLLTQRPVSDPHPSKWEFPGGKMRDGESPEESLRRELEEELHIRVAVDDVFHVVNHRYPHGSVLLIAYSCRWAGGRIRLEAHQAYRWVDVPRLLDFDLAEADRPIAHKLLGSFARGPG